MTHASFPGGLEEDIATGRIRDALAHIFPLNAVRMASDDEIALLDDSGNDWTIIIKKPVIEEPD